jgi:hypothetical protein
VLDFTVRGIEIISDPDVALEPSALAWACVLVYGHRAHWRLADAGDYDFLSSQRPLDQVRKLRLRMMDIG